MSKTFVASGLVAVVAVLLAGLNTNLESYDPVASASGAPKLAAFIAAPASPSGWQVSYETQYTINKPLFGQSSLWYRYVYSPASTHTPGDLTSSLPITADVINAGGLSGFEQYGVTACYSFHGFNLRDVAKVSLGDGVSGQALSYSSVSGSQDWSIVYWIWPVKMQSGTRYERIILYLQNTAGGAVKLPAGANVSGIKNALVAANPVDRRLLTNRAFLVAFARQIIAGQTKQTQTSASLASVASAHAAPVVATRTPATLSQQAARRDRVAKLIEEGKLPNGSDGVTLPAAELAPSASAKH